MDGSPASTPPLAVVLKGYPRLSETFIAQELLELQNRGHRFDIWSLRRPYDGGRTHPIHDAITARCHYLPEYLHQEPLRVLRAWWAVRGLPGYARARRIWLADLRRDRTRNRVRRWGQALVMAAELPAEARLLYAHFLHTPASVTRYAALIRGLPCDEATLRTYSSEEVRSRICSGDPSWKELVAPAVAAAIEQHGFFGARCDPGR